MIIAAGLTARPIGCGSASALRSSGEDEAAHCIPFPHPGLGWFRRGWHVAAASRVNPEATQATVDALLERIVTIGAQHGAQFVVWGASSQWPSHGAGGPQLKRDPLGG